MAVYNIYPMVDENYKFPPEIRQAMAIYPELVQAFANKTAVGLSNVDNTSDINKPISTAQQTALDTKAPKANPTFTGTVAGITKAMIGLGNVDNTADADKPVPAAMSNISKGCISATKVVTNTGGITNLAVVNNIPTFSFIGGRKYRIVWDSEWYGTEGNTVANFMIATAAVGAVASSVTGLTFIGARNAQSPIANYSSPFQTTAYFDPPANVTVQIKFCTQIDLIGTGTALVVQGNRAGAPTHYRIYDDGAQF